MEKPMEKPMENSRIQGPSKPASCPFSIESSIGFPSHVFSRNLLNRNGSMAKMRNDGKKVVGLERERFNKRLLSIPEVRNSIGFCFSPEWNRFRTARAKNWPVAPA
jgi:hypothetical protein